MNFLKWILIWEFNSFWGIATKVQSEQKISAPKNRNPKDVIKVMTFNIWNSGAHVKNGLQKIADHIKAKNPDIVALQEVENDRLPKLLELLGSPWRSGTKISDSVVLTRHKFANPTTYGHDAYVRSAVKLRKSDSTSAEIAVWAVHLDYRRYGPYIACNKAYSGKLAPTVHSDPLRTLELIEMRQESQFQMDLDSNMSMLLLGDFNEPSHLDWTARAAHLHCNTEFMWPTSEFVSSFGFKDSFREIHKDPVENSGFTWSPIYSDILPSNHSPEVPFQDPTLPEPKDRIDFIYHKKESMKPRYCETYAGDDNFPKLISERFEDNNWPSDHKSVICTFEI